MTPTVTTTPPRKYWIVFDRYQAQTVRMRVHLQDERPKLQLVVSDWFPTEVLAREGMQKIDGHTLDWRTVLLCRDRFFDDDAWNEVLDAFGIAPDDYDEDNHPTYDDTNEIRLVCHVYNAKKGV